MYQIQSLSEIMSKQLNEPNEEPIPASQKPNEEQCVLLCLLREITKNEMKQLVKIGLRIIQVDGYTMQHVDLVKLQSNVDCVILDCRDKQAFEILRKKFQEFKDNFNVCLLQRTGYLSDKDFAENFESITKNLNLDALDVPNWKKSLCNKPYLSRPINKWALLLKKILRLVLKL